MLDKEKLDQLINQIKVFIEIMPDYHKRIYNPEYNRLVQEADREIGLIVH
ncbi:MAG: hypothetical protein WCW77_00655 [Patescibacteria group bacterium]